VEMEMECVRGHSALNPLVLSSDSPHALRALWCLPVPGGQQPRATDQPCLVPSRVGWNMIWAGIDDMSWNASEPSGLPGSSGSSGPGLCERAGVVYPVTISP
jgi:hypothetical protein